MIIGDNDCWAIVTMIYILGSTNHSHDDAQSHVDLDDDDADDELCKYCGHDL